MKWLVTRGVWIMTAILIISTMFMMLLRTEKTFFPSVTNVRPSGYAAFFELLNREGYEVYLERGPKPDFSKADLVIAPTYPADPVDRDEFDEFSEEMLLEEEPKPNVLDLYWRDGGTVFEIEVDEGIRKGRDTKAMSAIDPNRELAITTDQMYLGESQIVPEALFYAAWIVNGNPFVGLAMDERGRLVLMSDGMAFANENLDQQKNAEFALDIVRTFAPKGATIAFYEAGIGNAIEPSAANTLGNWAVVARWQAVLLFVTLIFALGRRFGPPIKEIREVRSSREFFDAVADVLRRRGDTGVALHNVIQECDERLAKAMPSVRTRSKQQLVDSAPKELRDHYHIVQQMANSHISPSTASNAARKLLKMVTALERDSRAARGLNR